MSVSPIGIPIKPYIGQLFSTSFKRWGQSGTLVKAVINWQSDYGAGDNLPALCVITTFQATAVGNVPATFKPFSCYINNLGSNVPIYIFFPDTCYEIVCPANSEGWFSVVTNASIAWIFGQNFQSIFPVSTTIFFTDLLLPNYVNTAVPQSVSNWLSSPNISAGGGADVGSVAIVVSGSSYANGNLSISGGGGTGATASGTLNEWGQFTNVIVTNGGNNDYTGTPVVTATGANTPPAAFNPVATYTQDQKFTYNGTMWKWHDSASVSINLNATAWNAGLPYNVGNQTNYSGSIYVCINNIFGGPPPPPGRPNDFRLLGPVTPTNNVGGWVDSGIVPSQTAQFQASLTTPAPVSAVRSVGYAPPALGDQVFGKYLIVGAIGVIQDNVFGTPFGSGFIYLTSLHWVPIALSTNVAQQALLELIASDGTLAFGAVSILIYPNGMGDAQVIFDNCSIKLDATKTWRIYCTLYVGSGVIGCNFMHTFSYSQF